MKSDSDHHKRNLPSSTRREDIVSAARDLYEERGFSKTTVCDITDRVGVSRTLFYHYFPDKDAVTSAVIDRYVDEFVQAAHAWNENRRECNAEEALASFIQLGRMSVFENDPFHQDLATQANSGLYLEFVNSAVEGLAQYVYETFAQDPEAHRGIGIEHAHETIYVVIYGLIGYARSHPDADDAMLVDILAQTLRLEREPNGEGGERNGE